MGCVFSWWFCDFDWCQFSWTFDFTWNGSNTDKQLNSCSVQPRISWHCTEIYFVFLKNNQKWNIAQVHNLLVSVRLEKKKNIDKICIWLARFFLRRGTRKIRETLFFIAAPWSEKRPPQRTGKGDFTLMYKVDNSTKIRLLFRPPPLQATVVKKTQLSNYIERCRQDSKTKTPYRTFYIVSLLYLVFLSKTNGLCAMV